MDHQLLKVKVWEAFSLALHYFKEVEQYGLWLEICGHWASTLGGGCGYVMLFHSLLLFCYEAHTSLWHNLLSTIDPNNRKINNDLKPKSLSAKIPLFSL